MRAPDIKKRLLETGRSQTALGRHLNISKDSVNRLVNGKRDIEVEEADKIRAFFADTGGDEPAFITIPVYGYAAAGGDDRISVAEDRAIDRIEIPVGLVRGQPLAIRVAGDSMEPRLFSGETVIVDLNVRPARFGDCVVELKDNTALVKQYRGERDGQLFLFQYNPEKEIRLKATEVKAIHAVKVRR